MSGTERWLIRGRVQGVGYREWMVDAARRTGVRGYVRNLPNGTVEAIVSADQVDALDRLATLCRAGPDAASVQSLDRSPAAGRDLPAFFERR